MERRLLVNSICLFLVCATTTIAVAQDTQTRELDDPYFQANKSWSPPQPSRAVQNSLQPRTPVVPAPSTHRQLAPRQPQSQAQGYPLLQNSAQQLQPKLASQPQSNTDFRPRSVQASSWNNPRFLDDDNSFRPRNTQANNVEGQSSTGTLRQKPLFEETTVERKPFQFEQSNEFDTPRKSQAVQPESQKRAAPSNPKRDFTQATTSSATMRTSAPTGGDNTEGDEFEPGRVVAIVGGKPIFVGDMLFEINQRLSQMMPGASAEQKAMMRPEAIKRMLPQYIDAKLLLIDTLNSLPEGANFDDVVESASGDFDEKVLPTIMEKSEVKSALELDAKLRAQGGSLRQLRYKWSEEQIIKYFVGQKLNVNTDVSHQEMLADYQANLDSYRKKAKVRWEELSIRFDKVPNRTQAEQMLKRMGNEVVHGAKFDAVAKRSSQGFTAYEGGKHDWTSLGSLVYKDVEKALFSIPIYELSDVIASKDGFHIVRVLERTQETFTPFLEAQVEIRTKLENEKRSKAFEDHLTKLRRRIPFEVQMDDVQLPEHLADQGNNLR